MRSIVYVAEKTKSVIFAKGTVALKCTGVRALVFLTQILIGFSRISILISILILRYSLTVAEDITSQK